LPSQRRELLGSRILCEVQRRREARVEEGVPGRHVRVEKVFGAESRRRVGLDRKRLPPLSLGSGVVSARVEREPEMKVHERRLRILVRKPAEPDDRLLGPARDRGADSSFQGLGIRGQERIELLLCGGSAAAVIRTLRGPERPGLAIVPQEDAQLETRGAALLGGLLAMGLVVRPAHERGADRDARGNERDEADDQADPSTGGHADEGSQGGDWREAAAVPGALPAKEASSRGAAVHRQHGQAPRATHPEVRER
jgi:hypothetical protein